MMVSVGGGSGQDDDEDEDDNEEEAKMSVGVKSIVASPPAVRTRTGAVGIDLVLVVAVLVVRRQ